MNKKRYIFCKEELIGIELPHIMIESNLCTWCRKKTTKTAILTLSYRICKDCLKNLEFDNKNSLNSKYERRYKKYGKM